MVDFSFDLEASPDAPGEARLAIRSELGDALPAPVLYDLMLAVTELIDNSVAHGAGGPIEVRISDGDGLLRAEVAEEQPPQPILAEPSPDLASGLGLRIVDAISERWGAGGNAVWFELRMD